MDRVRSVWFRRRAGLGVPTREVPVVSLYDSLHDGLTGVLARDAWQAQAEQAVATGAFGAVVLLDVDRFKRWNDWFGHGVGDEVLARVAQVLRNELRHADLLGRLGGDELVVLLSGGHDAASAELVGERLRRGIAELRIAPPGGGVCGPTASIGIALCSASTTDLTGLLDTADRAMYAVKRAGGDGVRVVEAGGLEPVGSPGGAGRG